MVLLAKAEFTCPQEVVLGEPLCHQGKELWAEIRRLYDVRDDKKESDLSFSEMLRVQKPEPHSCTKGGAGKV